LRERERKTNSESETGTERWTERQTKDRQTNMRKIDRQQTDKPIRDKCTSRQTTYRQTDKEKERQTVKQKE